jgi:hypothetical protein
MFCNSCGTHIQAGQTVCPSCGKTTWTPAPGGVSVTQGAAPLVTNRVAQHVNTLGILWIVYGVLAGIVGLGLLVFANFFGTWLQAQETPMPPFIRPMLGFIGVVFVIAGLVRVITGWALYSRQSWGRILALVVGILTIINFPADFPFGTTIGIYTLWVLMSHGADQQYHQLAYAR